MKIDKLEPKNEEVEVEENLKNDVKKILLKNTRFFNKTKFLIIIFLVERRINKIVKSAFDHVFEEYLILY